MPIHDWTRVDPGLFHAFHQSWISVLARALNTGVLRPGYFALSERSTRDPVPGFLTLELPSGRCEPNGTDSGLAVTVAPPRTRVVRHAEDRIYVHKADRIAVRHPNGRVVAFVYLMIERERGGQARISDDDYVEGAPELVAEITSSSVSYDLGKKLNSYRRNGVREYVVWRVLDREVDWFMLHDGRRDRRSNSHAK